MILPSFARESVVRVRPVLVDQRGSKVRTTEGAERLTVAGCSFQPSSTTADNSVATDVTSAAVLYAPFGADFKNGDLVEVHGETWRVEGHPFKWQSFGPGSHQVVNLKRQGA